MSRRSLALSLALCVPCAAVAAPVPPPRLVTAEAVVKPPKGGPRDLAVKVASAPFLAGVAKSQAALGRLRWERDPAAWLGARLRATVDAGRGAVTLRLTDCPRKDAVALLGAVVEAYKAELLGRGRDAAQLREREVLVRQLVANQQQANPQAGGGLLQLAVANNLDHAIVEAGPSKAEVDASVILPPHIVQPGLPGKEGPDVRR